MTNAIALILSFFTSIGEYNRKDWSYPIDSNRNCKNTRAEVLESRSKSKVSYRGNKRCYVSTGKWKDYYYNQTHFDAKKVEIDHLVPLYHAHKVGGHSWSKKQKRVFANDPLNLVITQKKYNRQKGAKTILEWLPLNRAYACKYMSQWMAIKRKYQLEISTGERSYFAQAKCPQAIIIN